MGFLQGSETNRQQDNPPPPDSPISLARQPLKDRLSYRSRGSRASSPQATSRQLFFTADRHPLLPSPANDENQEKEDWEEGEELNGNGNLEYQSQQV